MKRLPIGISDFKKLIENNYYFVDTSSFIADIYREPADIALITRPRRFGKTLNMSMLRYFFDHNFDSTDLFKGLEVSGDSEVMETMNTYPTVYITFKDMKNLKWGDTYAQLKFLIAKLYNDHYVAIEKVLKNDFERNYFDAVKNQTATSADYKDSLKNLTEYLFRVYDKPVLLIIDEYDVPIQSGWISDYYDEIIDFMKGFLSGALKDNAFLFKGVLTGIYRVAKESIFSGLNNLKVYTTLKERYSSYFGFTQDEINLLVNELNINDEVFEDNLKLWYNGYNFGGNIIYNPWSVINCLFDREFQPYWINTSSNDLIISLIEENMKIDDEFRKLIEKLISGETITELIDDSAALRDLQSKPDSIWTLFLFSGYLKAESYTLKRGKYNCKLRIPNEEVRIFFQDTVLYWLEKSGRRILTSITKPLLNGDGEVFVEKLKQYVLETLSYFDIKEEPENTYHMLLLGMFAHLTDEYWIKSNRESGHGRFDIMLKAKDKTNFSAIIEIKASVEKTADGMVQIEEKAYTTELESEGYTNILKVSLGVDGKNVEALVERP
ncbi:MAG TPA: AAA family ATPase [Thermotogota bacterium]|nr:AAA family ATPase [Thermotogota bacterium]